MNESKNSSGTRDNEDEALNGLLHSALNSEVPSDVEQLLRGRLEEFRGRLDERERGKAVGFHRAWFRWRRLAWAGGVGGAAVATLLVLFVVSQSPVSWARVVETFRSVSFFNATLYLRDNALARPEQFELWRSEGGQVRLRRDRHVFFAGQGETIRGFDVVRCREIDVADDSEVESARQTLQLVRRLVDVEGSFSLHTVLAAFPGDVADSTPLLNRDAGLSGDLTAFDLVSRRTPEWMRVWVLRESSLPIRIQSWDPRDGESMDVLFSYTRPQPEEFFDPEAFAAKLSQDKSRTDRAYALMKDPGGRAITAEDLFEQKGYHLPVVQEAGVTPEGIVWVVAGRSTNRRPDGYVFNGFSRLADDLGTAYFHQFVGHQVSGDVSLDFFIPYSYGYSVPQAATLELVCEVQHYEPDQPREIIGTIPLTEWKKDAYWPERFKKWRSLDYDPRLTLAYHLYLEKEWERLEKTLALIPGEPEQSGAALRREMIRFYQVYQQTRGTSEWNQGEKAYVLGKRLAPLELAQVQSGGKERFDGMFLGRYLRLLINRGERNEVRALFKEAKPYLAEHDLMFLANTLSWEAHFEVGEINALLGTEIILGKTRNEFTGPRGWWTPQS